ncbi:MAG: DUF6049 family protein [Arcanobacterium sp.]|nr:DUF6049 family protein [Arcanobacterium sp.]MDY5589866.1 DUF6049 family protein [Arcanobacterium sp.]
MTVHIRHRWAVLFGVLICAITLIAQPIGGIQPAFAAPHTASAPKITTAALHATGAPAHTTAQKLSTEPLAVTITSLSSLLLSAQTPLTVRVDIANNSAATAQITRATLASSPQVFANDSELYSWFSRSSHETFPETATVDQQLPLTLAAGEHATISFALKASDRQWHTSSYEWGARGLEVQIAGNSAGTAQTATARTVVVATSTNSSLPRFPAAVAVICTPSVAQLSELPGPLESLLPLAQRRANSGARLSTDSAPLPTPSTWQPWDHSGVNLFWDPMGSEALARSLSSSPLTPSAPETHSSTSEHTSSSPDNGKNPSPSAVSDAAPAVVPPQFQRAKEYLLPPFDADISALAHANAGQLGKLLFGLTPTATGTDTPAGAAATNPAPLRTNAISPRANAPRSASQAAAFVPLSGAVDTTTLAFLKAHSAGTPIVSARSLGWEQSFYFPDAQGVIHSGNTDYPALVANPTVSAALSGTLLAPTSTENQIPLSALNAEAVAVASSAIFYRQAPSQERSLVAMVQVPCLDPTDPTAHSQFARWISTLLSAPWLSPTDLSRLPAREQRSEWTASRDPHRNSGELSTSGVQQISTFFNDSRELEKAFPVGTDFSETAALAAYQLLATNWRSNPAARARFAATLDIPAFLAKNVHIESSASLNLIAEQAQIPIRVHSNLNVPIAVTPTLDIPDARLAEGNHTAISLKPDNTSTVQIPVEARGSGLITVTAQLTYTGTHMLATSRPMNIWLHASWESIGTAILGGIVLLIFVIGIIHSARKGRRSKPISNTTFTEGLASAQQHS